MPPLGGPLPGRLLAAMMLYYRWPLTWAVLWLPLFIVGAVLAAAGSGLILSALNVSFRDVKYAVPFMVQMGLFVTPVIYPAHYIPQRWRFLLGLNPMAGVVEGFRWALLGKSQAPGALLGVSIGVVILILLGGLYYFRRTEAEFAYVV